MVTEIFSFVKRAAKNFFSMREKIEKGLSSVKTGKK
jgi:hypothetical protein